MLERIDFSSDSKHLVTWSKGKQVNVWEVESGQPVLTFEDKAVTSAGLDPSGQVAYAGTMSGEIVRAPLRGARTRVGRIGAPVAHIRVAPGGKHLMAHGHDGNMHLIEVATGKTRALGKQPADKAVAAFSRDGALLAAGGTDTLVHVWSVRDASRHDVLRGHEDSIYEVEFAPDVSFLASASDDGTARIWDLASGQSQVLRGHDDDVFALSIRADGRELVTASLDSSVRVWPVGGSARVLVGGTGEGKMIDHVLFSGDGARVHASSADALLHSWDLATGERSESRMPRIEKEKAKDAGWPVINREVSKVAVPRSDGRIELFEQSDAPPRILRGHEGPLALAMSRDGKTLVSTDKKGTTLVWDLSVAEPSARPLFQGRPLAAMNLSPDGRTLVTRDSDPTSRAGGALATWDLASGERRASIDPAAAGLGHIETPYLAFSPDGRYVIGNPKKGTSILWKVDAGTLHTFGRPGFYINSVEYSPDSRQLAASMSDRTIQLWDLETLRSQTLRGHRDLVFKVVFSPDGETIASASYDRTVRLWDAHTGRSIRILRGHSGPVMGVAFSPDGGLLASGSGDGTVRLWDLSALPSDRIDAVRARIEQASSARIQDGLAASPVTPPR